MKNRLFILCFSVALVFSAFGGVSAAENPNVYLDDTVTFKEQVKTSLFTHHATKGDLQLETIASYQEGSPDFDYFVVTLYDEKGIQMGNKVAMSSKDWDVTAWDVPSGKYYFVFEKPRNGFNLKVDYQAYPYNG